MDLDNMEDLVDVTSLHLFRPEALLWSTPCLQQKCLNVRQKLGTKNVLSHSHHTLTLSHSHTLTLSLSHSHSFTLTVSHSLTLVILNNFCFHVYAQKSLSHSLTLTLSHSLNVSLFHTLIHSLSTC